MFYDACVFGDLGKRPKKKGGPYFVWHAALRLVAAEQTHIITIVKKALTISPRLVHTTKVIKSYHPYKTLPRVANK